MNNVACHCKKCLQYTNIEVVKPLKLECPNCKEVWGEITDMTTVFDHCPSCGCRQFYLMKDFNQLLGCFVMGVGIVLVPATYGLSLPVFALVDWLIYRKVKTITICYKCAMEFREFPTTKIFKSFMHHIGLKYDKYR